MTVEELLTALRRQEVMDNLRCLGCGYEHRCSIRGCAINRAAAEMIEKLAAENEALRNPPNLPLTLDELRGMAWSQSPVWCSDTDGVHAGLLCIRDEWCTSERTPHIWLLDEEGHSGVYSIESLLKCGARFYRRKPEEGT